MEKLLVDIGNTSWKFAFADDEQIYGVKRCFGTEAPDFLEELSASRHFDVLVYSSVIPLEERLLRLFGRIAGRVADVKACADLPVRIRYSTPSTLGADRLAAVIGARYLFRNENCLIFDMGTAVTVDFLTSEGEYLGGNISLGLRTRFAALHEHTGKLPLAETPEVPETGIGDSTLSAIKNGIAGGMLMEIEGYMRRYPDYKMIFTGGDAIYFAKELKKTIFVVCNLVLVGLFYIAGSITDEQDI